MFLRMSLIHEMRFHINGYDGFFLLLNRVTRYLLIPKPSSEAHNRKTIIQAKFGSNRLVAPKLNCTLRSSIF